LAQVESDVGCGLLTLSEAAALAGRSYSWARDRVIDGGLEAYQRGGNRTLVRAASLFHLLEMQKSDRRQARARHARPRLVVDNDPLRLLGQRVPRRDCGLRPPNHRHARGHLRLVWPLRI